MTKVKIVIGLLFLGLLILSMIILSSKISNKKETKKRTEKNLVTLSKVAAEVSLPLNDLDKPTILIYMNSECEHCQWQLREIVKIEKSLKGAQVVLVSFEPLSSLNDFLAEVPFQERDVFNTHNILPTKVDEVFGSSLLPQIFIYRNNRLVKSFKGETNVELLADALGE